MHTPRGYRYNGLSPEAYDQKIIQLHGDISVYIEGITELLALVPFSSKDTILELCCGTGIATEEMGKRDHDTILAIDENYFFVQAAEKRCKSASLRNISFEFGDITSLLENERKFEEVALRTDPMLMQGISDVTKGAPYDHIIMCNAATEILEEGDFFPLVREYLKEDGVFLFNVKIKDGIENACAHFFRLFRDYHNNSSPPHVCLGNTIDADIVPAQRTEEDILALLEREGFSLRTMTKKRYILPNILPYAFAVRERISDFVRREYTPAPYQRALYLYLEEELPDNFHRAHSRFLQEDTEKHIKTELLIAAEKR